MARSTTQTSCIDFSDVPRLQTPLVLQLRERKPSWWYGKYESMKKRFSPEDMTNELKQDLETASPGLTQEEADAMNARNKERLKKRMDKYVDDLSEATKVQAGDSREEAKFKQDFFDSLYGWIGDLLNWLVGKIKAIFDKIKEGLTWAMTKAKELFTILYDIFDSVF